MLACSAGPKQAVQDPHGPGKRRTETADETVTWRETLLAMDQSKPEVEWAQLEKGALLFAINKRQLARFELCELYDINSWLSTRRMCRCRTNVCLRHQSRASLGPSKQLADFTTRTNPPNAANISDISQTIVANVIRILPSDSIELIALASAR